MESEQSGYSPQKHTDSMPQRPENDIEGPSSLNGSDQFDPFVAIQEARVSKKEQEEKEEKQKREEADRINRAINRYRELSVVREEIIAQGGVERNPRNEVRHLNELSKLYEQLEPKIINLIGENVVEKFQEVEQRLIHLKEGQKVLEENRSAITPEDYQSIKDKTQQSILEIEKCVVDLRPRVDSWKAEIANLVRPILDKLNGAEFPKTETEVLRLLQQAKETIEANKQLASEADELATKLDDIDRRILDLIDSPEVVREIYNIYRKEQLTQTELTRIIVDKCQRQGQYYGALGAALRPEPLSQSLHSMLPRDPKEVEREQRQPERFKAEWPNDYLFEMIVDKFIELLAEKYGLNNPELDPVTRQYGLRDLSSPVFQVFNSPAHMANVATNQRYDPDIKQRLGSQIPGERTEIEVKFDALFVATLLGATSLRPDLYEKPYSSLYSHMYDNHSSYDGGSAFREFIEKKFRPFYGIFETIKAAIDAEKKVLEKLNIKSNGESFFSPRLSAILNQIGTKVDQYYSYRPSEGPLFPYKSDSALTDQQQAEKAKLTQTYQASYEAFFPLIERHVQELKEQTRERHNQLIQELKDLEKNDQQTNAESKSIEEQIDSIKNLTEHRHYDTYMESITGIEADIKKIKAAIEKLSGFSFLERRKQQDQLAQKQTVLENEISKIENIFNDLGLPEKVIDFGGLRDVNRVKALLRNKGNELEKALGVINNRRVGLAADIKEIKKQLEELEKSPLFEKPKDSSGE